MVGHVIVAPKVHVPSAYDLDPVHLGNVRLLQTRIGARLLSRFGEAGAYEHGRSPLCRFHAADRRHLHAHIHVLPLECELVSYAKLEPGDSAGDPLNTEPPCLRYLYQWMASTRTDRETLLPTAVPRHLVRSALEAELSRRRLPWIPLSASRAEQDTAVDETAELLRGFSPRETALQS